MQSSTSRLPVHIREGQLRRSRERRKPNVCGPIGGPGDAGPAVPCRLPSTSAWHRTAPPSKAQVPTGLQGRSAASPAPRSSWHRAQAPPHLSAALRRRLETGACAHQCAATSRGIPAPLQEQETGRTTRLHLWTLASAVTTFNPQK